MTNLEKYIVSLKADKKSLNTIVAYSKDIQQMLDFVQKDETEIEYMDLVNWKESISDMSSSSVARKIVSVRHYLEFLVDIDILEKNPAKKLKAPKINVKEKDYITKEEVLEMISNGKNKRDKAIIATYLSTGLRVSELIDLQLEDLENEKLIVKVKGDKDRIIFINEDCRKMIADYLKVRKDGCTNLFVSNQGTPMKRECISRTLKNIAKRSGLDKDISNHSLRHSFVSTVAEEFGIEVARVAVGHSSVQTTQRYTHTQETTIKNVMLGFTL